MRRGGELEQALAKILAVLGSASFVAGSACAGRAERHESAEGDSGAPAAGVGGAQAGAGGRAGSGPIVIGGFGGRGSGGQSNGGQAGIPVCPGDLFRPPPPDAGIDSCATDGPVEIVTTIRTEELCGCSWPVDANLICFVVPPDRTSCDERYSPACIGSHYGCGLSQGGGTVACGPLPRPDSALTGCCYVVVGGCAVGRPFFVAGHARLAASEPGEGWCADLSPGVSLLDPSTRAALADAYLAHALTEHASVASFARFALHCLALGAPSEIVAAAQQAALEELQHARSSFGLARAYSGQARRPCALDVTGALDGAADATAVAVAVAREGCIAETVSALLVAAARDAAEDAVVKQELARIAAEELEHALLAWRYLHWALTRGDAGLREALTEAFDSAERFVGLGAVSEIGGDSAALRGHGYLPPEERRRCARDVLAKVVRPAAEALLRSRGAREPRSRSRFRKAARARPRRRAE